MNRREFAKSALAAGLAPALPGLATPATAAPAINPFTYAWSAHYATLNRQISAEALARRFALPADTASAIFARLRTAGIVAAPNAVGVAQVTRRIAEPRAVLASSKPVEKLRGMLHESDLDSHQVKEDPGKSGDDQCDSNQGDPDDG